MYFRWFGKMAYENIHVFQMENFINYFHKPCTTDGHFHKPCTSEENKIHKPRTSDGLFHKPRTSDGQYHKPFHKPVLQMDIFINHLWTLFHNHVLQMDIFINHDIRWTFSKPCIQMDIFINHVSDGHFINHVHQMDIS